MNCASCGREPPAGSVFCNGCGARLVVTCARCGATPPPDSRFCNGCGATLSGEPTAAPAQTVALHPQAASIPERDPRAYTPKHLADKILQSRSAIEGERKQVTVLFADVKGSMELAEQLDPEEWHKILERFFEILTEGVHRFEGTVNQYTGDGIMALFGAPIAHEDHAQRACYAALHLRDEIARYATEVKRVHGLGFSTRMGIHSGDVVVGRIGDDLRMDYTAQGHTVGLAQRMESLAEPNTCFLSDATAQLAAGYFALDDLGEFRIKGVADPVHVHRLVGIGAARSRFDISRARGLSRFVGRVADLRTLEDALEQTAAGNGQVVGVVAEAGTGKSRLCFEFVERCRARGMRVLEGRAVAHGRNIPLLPILEIFRDYFGITPQDDDRGAREKIAGRMVLLDRGLADALPSIFEFLGVDDPERPAPQLSPEARQRQIVGLMRQIVQSHTQPTVTMIEDLHWLDAASAEYLAHMVDARADSRSLLLLNFRPEYHADWMQKSWYRQIPLTPLGADAIAELLAERLGTHSSLAQLAARLHARTGGNPFFTEEAVQTLIESGHLEGARGAFRLVTPIEQLQVPATVQAVLAARIDRLPEREKRLLQVASVIGKDFPEPLLAAIAELPNDELKAALAALRRAEFIQEQAIYPVVEYTFKHPLTQEVALGSLLRERRRPLHATVAREIEAAGGNLDEGAALLAHHWGEAGEARIAAHWHRRAAEWIGFNNPAEALRHWHSERALLDTLPETPENLTERAAVRAVIMMHLARTGDPEDQANTLVREAVELATRAADPHALSQVLNGLGAVRLYTGAVAEALDPLLDAVRRADAIGDAGSRVHFRYSLFTGYFLAGRMRDGFAIVEEGLQLAHGDLELGAAQAGFSPSLGLSVGRAITLSVTGRAHEGAAELDRVIDVARTSQMLHALYLAHSFYVIRCNVTGERVPALAHAREALNYAERTNSQTSRIFASLQLGLANVLNDGWREALEVLETALTVGRSRRLLAFESGVLAVMAIAHLGLGDHARALTIAAQAIDLGRRFGSRFWEISALLVRIRALRETLGVQATAEFRAALAEADAWIEMSGATSYQPFLHVESAELARLHGDVATRHREYQAAHRLFVEIGAPIRAAAIAGEIDA